MVKSEKSPSGDVYYGAQGVSSRNIAQNLE